MPTALTALCNCKNVSLSVCLAATGAARARRGLYAADTSCENEVLQNKILTFEKFKNFEYATKGCRSLIIVLLAQMFRSLYQLLQQI